MPVSASFREFLLDQLRPIHAEVRARSMFGGLGIYAGETFFAVVAEDRVYLKVNETTRAEFEAIGMGPFHPFGDDGMVMSYYELPLEILERVERLRPWVEAAIAVARESKSKKKASRLITTNQNTSQKTARKTPKKSAEKLVRKKVAHKKKPN